MNAQIYNIILEDSANIAGFFRDQPGGELCLVLFFDICQSLAEEGNVDALECVIERLYTICEMSRCWGDMAEEWAYIFLEVIETQLSI